MTSDVSQAPSPWPAGSPDQPGPWSVVRCGMPCSASLSHSIVNATSAWDSRADRGNDASWGGWGGWGGAGLGGAERRGRFADREPTAVRKPEAWGAGADTGPDRGPAVAVSRPAERSRSRRAAPAGPAPAGPAPAGPAPAGPAPAGP